MKSRVTRKSESGYNGVGRDQQQFTEGDWERMNSDLRGYLPQLDGIRAIAISLVLLTHFWTYPAGHWLNPFAVVGWIGVDLFFVLSGYLITSILWSTKAKPGYFRAFYCKRALRIFPLHIVLMLLVLVAMPASKELTGIREDWPLYAFHLANVVVAIHGWRLLAADITWSLSIEEQFYLVWPAVVRWLNSRCIVTLCIALIVLVPLARALAFPIMGKVPVYVLAPFRMDSFAFGALLAIVLRERYVAPEALHRWAKRCLCVGLPVLIVAIISNTYEHNPWPATSVAYSLVGILATALIVVSLYSSNACRALSHPWLVHVGKVSYGMYIYHMIIAIVCSKAQDVLGLRTGIGWLDAGVQLAGYSLLTVGVATLSYNLFEARILKLKHRFDAPPAPAERLEPTAQGRAA